VRIGYTMLIAVSLLAVAAVHRVSAPHRGYIHWGVIQTAAPVRSMRLS
jgi:hypothetical protein